MHFFQHFPTCPLTQHHPSLSLRHGPNPLLHQGENARLSSFIGAISIADLVKTTLGPKGMDKILQRISEHDQSVSVTNDGATILKSINLDNAAAKVLVDIARVQDEEVGDGTTSVAVLCGELL
jgi:T-complex protein 1 subunit beta